MSAETPADPSAPTAPLKRTPLYDLHVAAGARMVPFAGYDMPVQYPMGVLKEHLWTREQAGLFDVSHMGQAVVTAADGRFETVARALERLVPADVQGLDRGRQRYSQLLAPDGGILDDLMLARSDNARDEGLYLVVNAACKDADFTHISSHLPADVRIEPLPAAALVALQGPSAAAVLAGLCPPVAGMRFMDVREARIDGWIDATISRSGYTGEDGFEISVENVHAAPLWALLAANEQVRPIGLGARDSLRLEAGLPLYGHDIDTTTSPIEAGLAWSIQKRRRSEGGFPGSERIRSELAQGPARVRVGILPEGRAPAREGTEIIATDGARLGTVTSGGFAPSLNAPIAMGYVPASHAAPGTPLHLVVRGKPLPARITALPFVPHRYRR